MFEGAGYPVLSLLLLRSLKTAAILEFNIASLGTYHAYVYSRVFVCLRVSEGMCMG